jgi:hypothetical protein
MIASDRRRFERPLLRRYGPKRSAANFYRAAADDQSAIGGIALDSVEAAVTAAVRLGYKVAEAQIDRTARLARRMREAGDHATGGSSDKNRSDKKALDATEQLIFKAMMAGLGWLEGAAADPGNPLRRFATAQFQLLGSLLGLLPSDQRPGGSSRPPVTTPPLDDGVDPSPVRSAPARPAAPSRRPPQVKHAKAGDRGLVRRAVRVGDWDLSTETPPGKYPLMFYGAASGAGAIPGELHVGPRGSTLTVKTSAKTAVGLYKSAVCDNDGVQIGYIELTV